MGAGYMKLGDMFRGKKTAVRFLLTYILLLSIPITIAITTTKNSQSIIIDTAVENSQKMLSQNADMVYQYVCYVKKALTTIQLNNSLSALINNSYAEKNWLYYNSVKLHRYLKTYILANVIQSI